MTTTWASNKLRLWIPTLENYESGDGSTPTKQNSSTVNLAAQGMKVRIGMEASGHARWFERLRIELNF